MMNRWDEAPWAGVSSTTENTTALHKHPLLDNSSGRDYMNDTRLPRKRGGGTLLRYQARLSYALPLNNTPQFD